MLQQRNWQAGQLEGAMFTKADNCTSRRWHYANNSLVDWILWSTAQLAIFLKPRPFPKGFT
jgi:hypothetical protein